MGLVLVIGSQLADHPIVESAVDMGETRKHVYPARWLVVHRSWCKAHEDYTPCPPHCRHVTHLLERVDRIPKVGNGCNQLGISTPLCDHVFEPAAHDPFIKTFVNLLYLFRTIRF